MTKRWGMTTRIIANGATLLAGPAAADVVVIVLVVVDAALSSANIVRCSLLGLVEGTRRWQANPLLLSFAADDDGLMPPPSYSHSQFLRKWTGAWADRSSNIHRPSSTYMAFPCFVVRSLSPFFPTDSGSVSKFHPH